MSHVSARDPGSTCSPSFFAAALASVHCCALRVVDDVVRDIVDLPNGVVFAGRDPTAGQELWVSDGARGGRS